MQSIVILISGGGSNMAALVRAAQQEYWASRYGASITAVISNRADAAGLQWAQAQGIATQVISHTDFPDRTQFDNALAQAIAAQRDKDVAPTPLMEASMGPAAHPGEGAGAGKPPLVLLAGFMRILTPHFVQEHAGRLINIHPSLLPAFTGLHTHERALAAGCKFAGATVHRVTEVLDEGAILEQSVVPVLPEDDAHSLAARVLATEHVIYPRAVRRLLAAGLS
jgi:phosphoribosylglycinamide formyltransferase-1